MYVGEAGAGERTAATARVSGQAACNQEPSKPRHCDVGRTSASPCPRIPGKERRKPMEPRLRLARRAAQLEEVLYMPVSVTHLDLESALYLPPCMLIGLASGSSAR